MHVLAKSPEEVLMPDRLDVSLRGSLILAGHLQDPAVLMAASELPLRGMILASLASSIVALAASQPYPIILLEGFGLLAYNPVAFKLLSTSDQREVAVNAEPWDPFTGARPELVIPLPASGEPPLPQDAVNFAARQSVRVLRAPHLGKIGTLIEIRQAPVLLPSGVRAQAGEVRLENGESVLLPLANLEVLV
jgi:hypothetical protein